MRAMLLAAVVMLGACDTTGGEEAPDAAPMDAHVCTNVFDEACAAENGCGVEGHFCCKRFYPDSGVVKDVCELGTMCTSDICLEAPYP